MSLRPGILGQPAEMIDGMKVDEIIESTNGNGVVIEGVKLKDSGIVGKTDGGIVAAGYVGERPSALIEGISGSDATFATTTAYVLSNGLWNLSVAAYYTGAAAHTSGLMGISVDSGASNYGDIGTATKFNAIQQTWPSSTTDRGVRIDNIPIIINGTTLTWPDGSTSTITDFKMYGKARAIGDAWSATMYIQAIRIA